MPIARAATALRAQFKKHNLDHLLQKDSIRLGTIDYFHTLHRNTSSPEEAAKFLMVRVVILDEASMISSKLLEKVARMWPNTALVIAVGDLDQNFPFEWGKPFHDLKPLLTRRNACFSLTQYHRQESDLLRDSVNSVRRCNSDLFSDPLRCPVWSLDRRTASFVAPARVPPQPMALFAVDGGEVFRTSFSGEAEEQRWTFVAQVRTRLDFDNVQQRTH